MELQANNTLYSKSQAETPVWAPAPAGPKAGTSLPLSSHCILLKWRIDRPGGCRPCARYRNRATDCPAPRTCLVAGRRPVHDLLIVFACSQELPMAHPRQEVEGTIARLAAGF